MGQQPGGWGPPTYTPPPPGKPRAGLVIAIVTITLVLIVGTGIAAVTLLGRSAYPDQWDARVEFAVDFIEERKGEPFLHPVYVDFVPESAFVQDVTSQAEVTQEDRDHADDQAGMLRALGLVRGDVNLIDEQSTLQGSGTAAYYDPDTKRIHVRGTELDTYTKVTLVHELTHAWQDQHTDLGRLDDMATSDEQAAFRAVVEGDADGAENAWVDQLSTTAQDAYHAQASAKSDEATKGMSSVPDVMVASFSAPYALGPSFVEGIDAQRGQSGVEAVLLDPPTGERQLLEPWLFLAGKGAPVEVSLPGDDTGPDVVDSGSFGAVFTYLLLAEQVDPHVALAATDVLAGDAYRAERKDGKVCVTARFQADAGGGDALESAFDEWEAVVPGSTVEREGDVVSMDVCDPGTEQAGPAPAKGEPGSGRSSAMISLPTIRLIIWSQALSADVAPARAECVSRAFTEQLTVADLLAAEEAPDESRMASIALEAREACG